MALELPDLSPTRNGDLIITWQEHPTLRTAAEWPEMALRSNGTLSFAQAKDAVQDILTPEFLRNTSSVHNPKSNHHWDRVLVAAVQHGLKNAIFRVTAFSDDQSFQFILVTSKGAPDLDKQTTEDYHNLKTLYQEVKALNIPPFSTKPYVLSRTAIPAFSGQYFSRHVELNTQNAYWQLAPDVNIPLGCAEYFMHDQPKAEFFNETTEDLKYAILHNQFNSQPIPKLTELPAILAPRIKDSEWYRIMKQLQIEIVAKLYLVYQAIGKVPKELELAAGDFMADPQKADFDLKLITLRGGIMEIDDIYQFLLNHTEYDRYNDGTDIGYSPFSKDSIEQGINQANELLERVVP